MRKEGDNIINPYQVTANLIEQAIRSRKEKTNPEEVNQLVGLIAQNESQINYEKFAEAFTQRYWFRNFWKAVLLFEQDNPINTEFLKSFSDFPKITVLGSGSAADTIACMAWLNQNIIPNQKVPIHLIDKSERHLVIAHDLISQASKDFRNANFEVSYQQAEVGEWEPKAESSDLILMSHFLTENPGKTEPIVDKVTKAIRGGGRIVAIEREKDPVWREVKYMLLQQGIPVFDAGLVPESSESLKKSLAAVGFPIESITPHIVTGYLPEQKFLTELIGNFFQAWKKQSLELVDKIFSDDAIYQEKVEEKPIRGIEGIFKYWEENPLRQSNIDVSISSVAYARNQVHCEFGGEFDTPKQHIGIVGAMILEINHKRKIQALREYFRTQKTPHFSGAMAI